jgi:hypothetical protein|tara:strand:+ start:2585 stop:3262 length:678 start_codon:yes stop_codon:yes gene_type:complete
MIVSHQNHFIFIKNYKTAGSSIEKTIYPYLNHDDIIAQTEDYRGINCFGDFDSSSLKNLPHDQELKYKKHNFRFFAHMPAWLIRKRIGNAIFKKYYKIAILRNPWDLIVSHFKWQNSSSNPYGTRQDFDSIIKNLSRYHPYDLINNLNRICKLNSKEIIIDKIIDFSDFKNELNKNFLNYGIKFDDIVHLKKTAQTPYQDYYNNKQKDEVYRYFNRTINLMKYDF